jgi:RNA polymerase sigma-70 factor (ECF subfamily)
VRCFERTLTLIEVSFDAAQSVTYYFPHLSGAPWFGDCISLFPTSRLQYLFFRRASGLVRKGIMENEGDSVTALPPSSLDDVLASARLGMPVDLGWILEQFRPYLLVIANSEFPQSLASKLAPSDIVQLTIAKGFGHFCDFRGRTPGELAHWLRRILLNHLKSAKREFGTEKRDFAREQLADSKLIDHRQLSPSGVAMSAEESELLSGALQRLSDDYRAAIALRYSENLSFAEMGLRLNRSEEAARKLWARAVRQLQRELAIDDSRRVTVARE